MSFSPRWPATQPGQVRDGRPIEWAGPMTALAYYGKGHMEVVEGRPIVCTDQDIIARVERCHRCGTDVKIFDAGRPDQCEESLLEELRTIFQADEPPGRVAFTAYAALAAGGPVEPAIADPLYQRIASRISELAPAERSSLAANMRRHWGRVLGHETVVTIERVGSRVRELRDGIGYLDGIELTREDLDFKPGQQCVLQSRIAYYEPPPADAPGMRGVQLLGGNITDLAMNLGGAYATHVRLTPEIIASGSVVRLPTGVSPQAAALAEPTACLLDCFQKCTHEVAQNESGSVLVKGAKPGGVACVIGSGAMALMSAQLATLDDRIVRMGRAREVVFIVRSQAKADFVRKTLPEIPISTIICENQAEMLQAVRTQYRPADGGTFSGFDDVVLAAGNADAVALAHQLIAPTGGRLMMFAGTRGPCTIESGVWHYGNAAVLGTSGCNTKMLEVSLGLFARRTLDVARLAGKGYTFADLKAEGGIAAFFADKHLRPYLAPNG